MKHTLTKGDTQEEHGRSLIRDSKINKQMFKIKRVIYSPLKFQFFQTTRTISSLLIKPQHKTILIFSQLVDVDEFEYCVCVCIAGNGGDTGKKTPKEEPAETYTPLLVAAQKGVIEVVNEILSQLPVTIYDTTSKDKNILQVAVENRRPSVIEAVHKQVNKELKLNLWSDLIESVDTEENNILHLAAKYEESIYHPWQIHGTAMQMQWEIKWYEVINLLGLQPLFLFRYKYNMRGVSVCSHY